jgi:hypothetical protein
MLTRAGKIRKVTLLLKVNECLPHMHWTPPTSYDPSLREDIKYFLP